MMNKKGFTLIELLAVIVILGVLLAVAVPAVTRYINSSKKSTFIVNVKQYVDAARDEALAGEYQYPVNVNDATLITFKEIFPKLEKGGATSSYDGTWFADDETLATANSFVLIVNEGTAEEPDYKYYVAAKDSSGFGLGDSEGNATIIEYNQLKDTDIAQLTTGVTYKAEDGSISAKSSIKVTRTYHK